MAVLESMQTGRPIKEMSTQLGRLPEWFEYAGALARTEEGTVQPTRGSLVSGFGQPGATESIQGCITSLQLLLD